MMLVRHLLSILLLPTTVTIVVPYLILRQRFSSAASATLADPAGIAALVAGPLVIACGLGLAAGTIRRFVTEGKGTLAPWDPTQRLVVTGVYRYVRNPMISGVLLILLGEALALRSSAVLTWALTFFVINAIYMPLIEEPGLVQRFGDDYLLYRRNVPRWVPRTTAWQPPGAPATK